MRKSLALLLSMAACCGLSLALVVPAVAASAPKSDVVISRVTVTAAKINGDSAISMTIKNRSKGPISLVSITSPVAGLSMIDYDTNMCQGNHAMMMLSNIFITSDRTQVLGYKYQGAMLRLLKKDLVKGGTIPVDITWSNFQKAHTVTIEAKVVAPPRHLKFGMMSMDM